MAVITAIDRKSIVSRLYELKLSASPRGRCFTPRETFQLVIETNEPSSSSTLNVDRLNANSILEWRGSNRFNSHTFRHKDPISDLFVPIPAR